MILYIDGSAGVSGDRLLAALVDAGLPLPWLMRLLARLPVPPSRIRAHRLLRRGGGGTALELQWRPLAPRRAPAGVPAPSSRRARVVIRELAGCRLPAAIKRAALTMLRRLVWAEATVHRCPPGQVVLHQVGDPDTLVDLVGFSAGLAYFRVTQVIASPLLVGARYQDHAGRWRNTVGPAVAWLTAHWPVWVSPEAVEHTTPTGAAMVTALARPPDPATGWVPRRRRGLRVVSQGSGWCWPTRRGIGAVRVLLGQYRG